MERKNERCQVRAVSQVHCERVIRCTFVPVWMNIIPKGNEQAHIVIGILSIGLFEIYFTRETYEATQWSIKRHTYSAKRIKRAYNLNAEGF